MTLPTVEYLVILGFLFVLGSVIGSALNVCIYRLPADDRLWPAIKGAFYPPSHCPRCKRPIRFYENVPIFGWIFLRGRCRGCRGRISIRYPLVELLTAVLFVLVYWFEIPDWWRPMAGSTFHLYGPEGSPASTWFSPTAVLHWRYALHLVMIVALIVATFIDIDLKIIPDAVTLPAMLLGVIGNAALGLTYIVPLWYQTPTMQGGIPFEVRRQALLRNLSLPGWLDAWTLFTGVPAWMTAHPHLHGLLLALAGILVGGGIVWGVRIFGRWGLGREAMGFGDVVLVAMIGSFIGWQASLVVFFLAPAFALLWAAVSFFFRFERELPFGPYLSLATLTVLLAFPTIAPAAEAVLALGPFLPVAGLILFVSLMVLLLGMHRIQKLLGFEYREPEPVWEWTSGDQLAHLAGECVDDRQGQWPRDAWRGTLTGRGMAFNHDWRGKR